MNATQNFRPLAAKFRTTYCPSAKARTPVGLYRVGALDPPHLTHLWFTYGGEKGYHDELSRESLARNAHF